MAGTPDQRRREVYDAVVAASEAALRGAHPGMSGAEVDALARNEIERRDPRATRDPATDEEGIYRLTQGSSLRPVELGGGATSSTVISPKLFDSFAARYDSELIDAFHAAGQRVVYHTCGGTMLLLEHVADMLPNAIETFTPPGMGADVDLA